MKFILCIKVILQNSSFSDLYTVQELMKRHFHKFGAPNILHSDNGGEFCNQIIKSLCEMWNDIKIVHGKPRHSESQGSVERANQDVEKILATWMEANNTTKWSEGL